MASKTVLRMLVVVLAGVASAGLHAQQGAQTTGDASRATTSRPATTSAATPTSDQDLARGGVIAPRDKINVRTQGVPEFTTEAIVDADGTFDFGFVGRVKAAGMTARQLEADLKKRLDPDWVINPQVTVDFIPSQSKRIMINGSVRQPGPFPFAGKPTVMDALMAAGSVTDAAGERAFIIRGNPDGSLPSADQMTDATKIYVDLQKLLTEGDLSENYTLNDGDYVYVEKAEPFTINGEIKSPGQYAAKRGLTVQQAIAIAGGLTDKGNKKNITILRPTTDPKNPKPIQIGNDKDYNTFQIRPGDTIVVHARIL